MDSDSALLAATMCTTQRDIPRRSEQEDQPMDSDTESNKPGKLKRKQDYEQGEPDPWDWVL